jgi:nicotinamidase/pyrazinamidase
MEARGQAMKNIFFFDVDTQRDFMLRSGALYVPGAERILPKLRRLFDLARKNDVLILSSMDCHRPDDPEFGQFPPHCVRGTEGQKKVDETLLPRPLIVESMPADRNYLETVRKYQQILLQKQALDVFTNPATEKFLRALPPYAMVFGVTTEHCVRHAVLGLRKAGVKTVVISDAICALGIESGQSAINEMRKAGVDFINTDTLLGVLAK